MGPGLGQDPNNATQTPGQMDDVKQAIVMLMEQQQANEPHPRPPTDQEAAQIRQKAMEMIQAKKAGGSMPPMPAGVNVDVPAHAVAGAGGPPGGQAPPPPSAPPPSPANVPPATGKNSAKDAMDLMLMEAKAQSPQSKDVKAPGNQQWDPKEAVKRLTENDPNYPWKNDLAGTAAQPSPLPPQNQRAAAMGDLKDIQNGIVDYFGSYAPNRFDQTPFAGLDRLNLNDVKTREPIDFFRTDAPKMMGAITGDHPRLQEKYADAQRLIQSLQPPQSQKEGSLNPEQQKASDKITALPDAYTTQEKLSLLGTDKNASPLPANEPQTAGASEADERASLEAHANKVADAVVSSGINSPEKAKIWLGNNVPEAAQVMDDPELKEQLAKYEKEYNDAKARNDDASPSVGQYIAAVLMVIAGHPDIAMNVLQGGRGKLQQRENLAGEQLMKARLHGMTTRAQALQQAKIDSQAKIAGNREEGLNRRADQQFNYHRVAAGRDAELKVALEHMKSGAQAITAKEKVAAAMKAAESIRRVNEFNTMLGEPAMTEQYLKSLLPQAAPKPQGMMNPQQGSQQPDQGMQQNAMRLIGLGA